MKSYRRRKAYELLKKNVIGTLIILTVGGTFTMFMLELVRTNNPYLF